MLFLVLIVCCSFLLDGCFLSKKVRLTNHLVKVELNKSVHSFQGLPLRSETKYLLFSLPILDSLSLEYSGGKVIIYPMKNNIFLIKGYANDILTVQGKMILPQIVHSDYIGKVDSEFFVTTVNVRYYSSPIRVGEWYYGDRKVFEKNRFRYPNGQIFEPIDVSSH